MSDCLPDNNDNADMNKNAGLHRSSESQVLEMSEAAELGIPLSIVIDFLIIWHATLIFCFLYFLLSSLLLVSQKNVTILAL